VQSPARGAVGRPGHGTGAVKPRALAGAPRHAELTLPGQAQQVSPRRGLAGIPAHVEPRPHGGPALGCSGSQTQPAVGASAGGLK
jgi:hypothetical protein